MATFGPSIPCITFIMTQRLEVITDNLKFLDKLSHEQHGKGINTDRIQKLKTDLIKKRDEIVGSIHGKDALIDLLIALG